MPWPWKKAKVSRISRIVADLQPPKPNSLVVETGFPTSLVDLFVKNHERLKKPIKKGSSSKQQRHHSHRQQQFIQPRVVEEVAISDPVRFSNYRELTVEPVNIDKKCESPENVERQHKNFDRCEVLAGEDRFLDSNQGLKGCGVVDDGNPGSNTQEKRLLFSVLKMFVVLALALSTTRIAVGITMSAFILLFLEYVGQRPFCLLKTCLLPFPRLIRRVFSLFPLRRDSKKGLINVGEDDSASDAFDLVESLESNTPVKEIQVVEPTVNMAGRVEANKRTESQTIYDLLNYDKRCDSVAEDVEAEDSEGGVLICAEEHRRSSNKIRRKFIKKLVPKKLRTVKKGKEGKEREANFISDQSSCWGEDKLWRSEDTEGQCNFDLQDLGCEGKLTLWQLMKEEKEERERLRTGGKEEFEHRSSIPTQALQTEPRSSTSTQALQTELRSSTSTQTLHTKPEMIVVEERVDIEKGGNSGYPILFLIVLAGLVGGRVLALVITVASCSMLKLVWRRRKCEK
ncbi:hypothetical protein GH714_016869 [Hevea brasiliensis]|uniref:Ethylene-responsive nuclear family protein n=1 Tax=Hevea brasiliensis TaxID=3981 RepID=A0A6A6MED6_HEVBR|nr:hypothetical protein GH714_016869 [Hevea brasiliensis]